MNDQVSWTLIFQVVGGVLLTGLTGACGWLVATVIDIRTKHAALEAQVDSDKNNTDRSFDDLKRCIEGMDEKLDRLIERRP